MRCVMKKTSWYKAMAASVLGLVMIAPPVPAAAATPGWHALLEDHSASAWRGWKEQGLPAGWHIAGGVLSKDGPIDDLVTKQSFGNFELELEWKMGKGGNSGIFFAVRATLTTFTGVARSTSCSMTRMRRTAAIASPRPRRPTRSTAHRPGSCGRSTIGIGRAWS